MTEQEGRELEGVKKVLTATVGLNESTLSYLSNQGFPSEIQDAAVGLVCELKRLADNVRKQAEDIAKAV